MVKEIGAFALIFFLLIIIVILYCVLILKIGLRWKARRSMNIMAWRIRAMEERKATNLAWRDPDLRSTVAP